MKLKTTLFIFTAFFVLVSCTPKADENQSGPKYFRHMQFSETPFDQYNGVYPINEKESLEINHYRFDYNEDGSLAEVSYRRGDVLLPYSSFGPASIKIAHSPGKEIHTYFDKDGNQVKRWGAWQSVYSLNEEGTRTGLKFEDKNGKMIENRNDIAYFTWKILDDGMVQEKRYNLADEETVMNRFCPFYELRFSYDESGLPVRLANYMEDTLYDCTVENCGDVGVSYFLFDYDENGALKKFSVHNSAGQLSNLYWGWAKFELKLDENGNVLERVSYDQDDELLGGKSNPINAYVYDMHGSVIERKFLNDEGKLVENGQGASIIRYSYDKMGIPVDTTMLNANEEVITKG